MVPFAEFLSGLLAKAEVKVEGNHYTFAPNIYLDNP